MRRMRSGSSPVSTAAVPRVSPAAAPRGDHCRGRAQHLRNSLPYRVMQLIQADEFATHGANRIHNFGRMSEAVVKVYTPAPLMTARTPSSFRKSRGALGAAPTFEGRAASEMLLPSTRRRVNCRFMVVKHTTEEQS